VEKGGEEGLGEVVKEEGIMLVVVRELSDERSVEQYLARGYRFAETKHFSGVFSDRVGVPRQAMDVFLGGCKTFAKRGTRPVSLEIPSSISSFRFSFSDFPNES